MRNHSKHVYFDTDNKIERFITLYRSSRLIENQFHMAKNSKIECITDSYIHTTEEINVETSLYSYTSKG